MLPSSDGSCVAVAEHHRPAERPTPFVYISTLHLWLPVLHLLRSPPPSSPPCQTTHPRLCLPSNDEDKPRIHCLLLYLLPPSLSLLLSYLHHLASSGTQHAATPLLYPKLAGLPLSVLQALKCVCKGCCSPQSCYSPAF